jgi:hypothetical protein
MRSFLRVILKRENLPLTLGTLGAVLIFLTDIFVDLSAENVLPLIVLLLGTLSAGLLAERIGYIEPLMYSLQSLAKSKPSVITRFYSGRKELGDFEEEIGSTNKEIFIVGNVMGWLLGGFQQVLTDKILEGCTVKLLLLNPLLDGKENPLIPMLAHITCNVRFDVLAYWMIDSLRAWHKRISIENPEAAARLQVRFYSTLVTLVILFLDSDAPSGKIRVELMPHRFEGRQRPSFDIQPEQGGELYSLLCARYEELWDSSTPLSEMQLSAGQPVGAQ